VVRREKPNTRRPASQRSSEKQPAGKVVRRLEGLEEGRLEGLEDDGPTYGEERAEEERAEAQVTESRAEKEAARAYHENLKAHVEPSMAEKVGRARSNPRTSQPCLSPALSPALSIARLHMRLT
jgi:hypothetical protein